MSEYPNIAIPTEMGFQLIKASDILYCKADQYQSRLFLSNGEEKVVGKRLKEMNELLDDETFFRIHHSTIINLRHLKEYINGPQMIVKMSDGTNLTVSLRKKGPLMKKFLKL